MSFASVQVNSQINDSWCKYIKIIKFTNYYKLIYKLYLYKLYIIYTYKLIYKTINLINSKII